MVLGIGGECTHLSSFGMTRRQTGVEGGVRGGRSGRCRCSSQVASGGFGNAFGGPLSAEKAWESAVRS